MSTLNFAEAIKTVAMSDNKTVLPMWEKILEIALAQPRQYIRVSKGTLVKGYGVSASNSIPLTARRYLMQDLVVKESVPQWYEPDTIDLHGYAYRFEFAVQVLVRALDLGWRFETADDKRRFEECLMKNSDDNNYIITMVKEA